MDKYQENKNNKIYILGFAFILIAFLIFPIHLTLWQKQMSYDAAQGQIIVLFDHSIKEKDLNEFTSSLDCAVDVMQHIGDYALLKVYDNEKFKNIIRQIQKNPIVKDAQADQKIILSSFSNDTYANSQWALNNSGYYSYISKRGEIQKESVADVDMNIPEAWEKLKSNNSAKRSVIVAVIDTGVDYKHPDLENHMWMNENEIPDDNIDNDGNGYIDDIYGWDFYNNDSTVCHYKYKEEYNKYLSNPIDRDDHGTHVAGIIAAEANNNIGIAGVASGIDIQIMSLKINGGKDSTGRISSAIAAIKYAEMMGADICNLSWGSTENANTLKQIIEETNMLFVAAAGNTGEDNDEEPIYPASFKLDNIVSVAYINAKGKLGDYSNYGVFSVDLAAPGEDIVSTVVGSYANMSGTSMAAPQVSGIAAILYSFHDHLYPSNVKQVLLKSIKQLPDLDGYIIHTGIPDASLIADSGAQLLQDMEAPIINMKTIYNKDKFLVPISSEDFGGSNIRTIRWMIGTKTKDDFVKGMAGSEVMNNEVILSKPGKYTFYASDYAGNETIADYEVKDDITAPKIKASFKAGNKNSKIITVKVSDNLSGIKIVKYMKGNKNAIEFLSDVNGIKVKLIGNTGKFRVNRKGIYTVFASDYRGNITVKHIKIKS